MQRARSYGREYSKWENGSDCSTAKEKTASLSRSQQKNEKNRLPCIFCGSSHWNDKCDIYLTVKEKLKNLRLCELYMKKTTQNRLPQENRNVFIADLNKIVL